MRCRTLSNTCVPYKHLQTTTARFKPALLHGRNCKILSDINSRVKSTYLSFSDSGQSSGGSRSCRETHVGGGRNLAKWDTIGLLEYTKREHTNLPENRLRLMNSCKQLPESNRGPFFCNLYFRRHELRQRPRARKQGEISTSTCAVAHNSA